MKVMTCKQLDGACEQRFQGNSFDEIAELSKQHALQMLQTNDQAHLQAMRDMTQLMQNPTAMHLWFDSKKALFEALPEI